MMLHTQQYLTPKNSRAIPKQLMERNLNAGDADKKVKWIRRFIHSYILPKTELQTHQRKVHPGTRSSVCEKRLPGTGRLLILKVPLQVIVRVEKVPPLSAVGV